MTIHRVDYEYTIREGAVHELDLDPSQDEAEKKEIAIADIKEMFPDIQDINIIGIETL